MDERRHTYGQRNATQPALMKRPTASNGIIFLSVTSAYPADSRSLTDLEALWTGAISATLGLESIVLPVPLQREQDQWPRGTKRIWKLAVALC